MIAKDFSKKREQDAKRFYERAEYYEQQRDEIKALENYLNSLEAYADSVEYDEIYWRSSSSVDPSYSIRDQIEFLFDLSTRLTSISNCLNNNSIKIYIVEQQRKIFDAVSPYQEEFDVGQIEFYNALVKLIEVSNNLTNENREYLDNIKKIEPEKEPDSTLKKIRVALLTISETKICLKSLESKPGCFIATAAYSTSTHPDLDTFRNFRDDKLLTNPVGKQLVNLYYQISPSIAQYLEKQPTIKSFVRHQLEHLARWMRN